ncbi:hypothetical protein RN001_005004 [Aquatica leii]|uniref:Anaphase-promoting complex subunit 4 n=1 Tax=Aquatica leii TaxID=1421715 RepID=A0AAN7SRZ0_9COLE|nr:hypothetical protein RN001_005004 [Aquatica leii]
MFQAIKQVEERNVANEIDILLWSDRMDLVAITNVKGEVALHRLSWTRAWCLSPPRENVVVQGLAWRPDGRVLAIAYSSGEVHLINVENKNVLHKIKIEGNVTCILWTREKPEKTSSTLNEEEEQLDYMKYMDYSSKYLPELSPLSSLSPTMTNLQDENLNSNLFQEQKELNLLIIGTDDGYLRISIFGQFVCAQVNMSDYLGHKCTIISTYLSDDLSLMYVTVKHEKIIKIILIKTDIFKTHTKELFAIALKDAYLYNLITYLSNIIILIKESWETSLLEMDAKLSKYASKVPDGVLSADFLELLMFGITSDEMQEFLLQDLTEKGLKKFGQVFEMCYASIQKLLLKHVTKAGQNITYHLSELRGMARLEHNFKKVGLSEASITEAIIASGSFLIKGGEIHQIINHFMINYKAFFRWLYSEIIHLMDDKVVPDLPKNTQQDISHIMEFVINFDNINSNENDRRKQFSVERLGQYLNDRPLVMPSESEENLWEQFLDRNECIQKDENIIKRFKNYSLIQQFKHLVASIENIFVIPKSLVAEQFSVKHIINCLSIEDKPPYLSKMNNSTESTFVTYLNKATPADGIYFLEIHNDLSKICGGYFYFKQIDNYQHYQVLDIKFYSPNVLSVLLQETNSSRNGILYQLSTISVRDKLVSVDISIDIHKQNLPKVNAMDVGLTMQKCIEGMACSYFSVSGCRRVSIVLSENRKKVRLFEMEAEEDDDEDADMTNSARESDTSMQEETSVVE